MAQPPAYNRDADFTKNHGSVQNDSLLNAELDDVSSSINGIRDNLAMIQDDDGALKEGIVTKDNFTSAAYQELIDDVEEVISVPISQIAELANQAEAASQTAQQAATSAQSLVATAEAAATESANSAAEAEQTVEDIQTALPTTIAEAVALAVPPAVEQKFEDSQIEARMTTLEESVEAIPDTVDASIGDQVPQAVEEALTAANIPQQVEDEVTRQNTEALAEIVTGLVTDALDNGLVDSLGYTPANDSEVVKFSQDQNLTNNQAFQARKNIELTLDTGVTSLVFLPDSSISDPTLQIADGSVISAEDYADFVEGMLQRQESSPYHFYWLADDDELEKRKTYSFCSMDENYHLVNFNGTGGLLQKRGGSITVSLIKFNFRLNSETITGDGNLVFGGYLNDYSSCLNFSYDSQSDSFVVSDVADSSQTVSLTKDDWHTIDVDIRYPTGITRTCYISVDGNRFKTFSDSSSSGFHFGQLGFNNWGYGTTPFNGFEIDSLSLEYTDRNDVTYKTEHDVPWQYDETNQTITLPNVSNASSNTSSVSGLKDVFNAYGYPFPENDLGTIPGCLYFRLEPGAVERVGVDLPLMLIWMDLLSDSIRGTAGDTAALSDYLPLTGEMMTGQIRSSVDASIALSRDTGDAFVATATRSDTGADVAFGVGVGGDNRGIWDRKLSKWVVAGSDSGYLFTQLSTPTASDDSAKLATTTYVKNCVPKSIGSATKPVYTNANGVVTACSYELHKTVPSDAVFTDSKIAAKGSANQPVYISSANTATACTMANKAAGLERVNSFDIDSGSGWIRYDSGLQICVEGVTGLSSAADTKITFPKAFAVAPVVIQARSSAATTTSNVAVWKRGAPTTTYFNCYATGSTNMTYIAFGRWK